MNTEKNIIALVQQWAKAEQHADASKLDELLTPEFFGVGPKGFVLNRQQWLGRLQGGLHYESIEVSEFQVALYQKAAVVVARQTQKASFGEQRADGTFRMSQTWIQNESRAQWQLACVQLSIIDANIPNVRP